MLSPGVSHLEGSRKELMLVAERLKVMLSSPPSLAEDQTGLPLIGLQPAWTESSVDSLMIEVTRSTRLLAFSLSAGFSLLNSGIDFEDGVDVPASVSPSSALSLPGRKHFTSILLWFEQPCRAILRSLTGLTSCLRSSPLPFVCDLQRCPKYSMKRRCEALSKVCVVDSCSLLGFVRLCSTCAMEAATLGQVPLYSRSAMTIMLTLPWPW
mmetsp:Transcript_63277/g.184934  ORF Transcript_63277/g.184934 Transcript_63277/m.184934 type:complete len:210 (+) Transcript_63277:2314-2943(+)